jgi:hypothetical protein
MRGSPSRGTGARDHFLTWYFTGPLGHFVAGFADWVQLLSRYAWARARGRSLS